MIDLDRARGKYLAREYNLLDPAADLACEIALDLFLSRCWANGSLMQNAIGLDHMAAVAKRFHRGPRASELCNRVAGWLRAVNLDTINLLEEVIDLGASGAQSATLQRSIRHLKERESITRQQLTSRELRLNEELQQLRMSTQPRLTERQPLRLRFARRGARPRNPDNFRVPERSE